MQMLWQLHSPRRAIALVLIAAQAACLTPPRPVDQPGPYLQSRAPKRIWVKLGSGEEMVVNAPRVFGDSLLGFTGREGDNREVWVALRDLREVRAQRVSVGRTMLLAALGLTVVGLALAVIPKGTGEHNRECTLPNPDDCEG